MKKQEHKLILDLYKHYKSVSELSDEHINNLYNKYGNIRDILKNLILEFEPNSNISEEYLDEKLKTYGISEIDLSKTDEPIAIQNGDNPETKKINKKYLLIFIGIFIVIGSSILFLISNNNLTEITIDKQVWMTENLNVGKFRNGDPIPEAKTDEEWVKAGNNGQPAWCYHDNDPANGEKYGKLYNWYAVNDPRGLAPEGWRIPSDEDWSRLTDFLGRGSVAGKKMKFTDFWADTVDGVSGNGTNESGFSGLPGGYRYSLGWFDTVGSTGCWWSSTEYTTESAWYRHLYFGGVERVYFNKANGFSVRCVKD